MIKIYANKFFPVLSIFCLNFHSSEQRPPTPNTFIQLFDENGDRKIDIETEMKSAFEDPNRPSLLSILEQDINNKIGSSVPIKLQFKLSDVEALLGVPQNESPVGALLNASDADANGFLTLRELQNFLLNFAKKIIDANHDGFVTETEFDAIMMGWQFKRYDLDKDGRLTKKELEAMMDKLLVNYCAAIIAAKIVAKKKDAIPVEVAKAQLPKFGVNVKPAQIDAADLNRDGILTPGEFIVKLGIPLEMAKRIFNDSSILSKLLVDGKMVEEADTDGNKSLSLNELQHLVSVDAIMKLGDANRDGLLTQKEYIEGINKYFAE